MGMVRVFAWECSVPSRAICSGRLSALMRPAGRGGRLLQFSITIPKRGSWLDKERERRPAFR
jgi:hypothetical protein